MPQKLSQYRKLQKKRIVEPTVSGYPNVKPNWSLKGGGPLRKFRPAILHGSKFSLNNHMITAEVYP